MFLTICFWIHRPFSKVFRLEFSRFILFKRSSKEIMLPERQEMGRVFGGGFAGRAGRVEDSSLA